MRAAAALVLALAACAGSPARRDFGTCRWRLVPTGTNASLRGLCAVDASVAWASGSRGAILRTTDGGRCWTNVAPADAPFDFRDVHAFDVDTAVAMVSGQPARLYRTADGGRSWAIVHEDPRPGAFFDAIAFAGDRGVPLGDPQGGAFTVLATADAGRTWTPLGPGLAPLAAAGEAAFAASGSCAALAADGSAWLVTGGTSARALVQRGGAFVPAPLPLAQGAESQGAFGIALRDARTAVAVGGDYRDPERTLATAAWTQDGGASWQAAAGGAGGYRCAAIWLDDRAVLAAGDRGCSLSDDGGRTWRPFAGGLAAGEGFHALARGRDGSIWAAGAGGCVARLRTD
jgi:photosystem II stability/assembly factor-like uncharacterized protein